MASSSPWVTSALDYSPAYPGAEPPVTHPASLRAARWLIGGGNVDRTRVQRHSCHGPLPRLTRPALPPVPGADRTGPGPRLLSGAERGARAPAPGRRQRCVREVVGGGHTGRAQPAFRATASKRSQAPSTWRARTSTERSARCASSSRLLLGQRLGRADVLRTVARTTTRSGTRTARPDAVPRGRPS